MSNTPEWITKLVEGEQIVVCFPYTGNIIYAKVIQNCPNNNIIPSMLGTLTVKYTWNKVERVEDLLYDDYSNSVDFQNNWYAYCVV